MTLVYTQKAPMTSNGLVWEEGKSYQVSEDEGQRLLNTFKGWFTADTEQLVQETATTEDEHVVKVIEDETVVTIEPAVETAEDTTDEQAETPTTKKKR